MDRRQTCRGHSDQDGHSHPGTECVTFLMYIENLFVLSLHMINVHCLCTKINEDL